MPIARSLGGVEIPLLTITNFDKDYLAKKVIIMAARVHPSETNSSWIIHGFIKFLLSADKVAHQLRTRCVFKIIPMLNPDGVLIGNNRTSFLGKDLNRCFNNPH